MAGINDKHYVTPVGFEALKEELIQLNKVERPKVVETVRWAASNGDRSENGDYIYGKRRLREIDRRVRYLVKRIENAVVVDPSQQQNHEQAFFGATITYLENDNIEMTVKIVGLDEADASKHKISYICPLAKALLKSREGDVIDFKTNDGLKVLEILKISYEII